MGTNHCVLKAIVNAVTRSKDGIGGNETSSAFRFAFFTIFEASDVAMLAYFSCGATRVESAMANFMIQIQK
jgi:hypothetical protein